MPIESIYKNQDDIPETINFRDLFTEKNGQWELTGIAGIKTEADVQRLTTAAEKERTDHKATKDQLRAWGDLKPDEVHAQLDRIPELEAAADGKLDDAAIDEIANKRADGIVRSKTAPLERQITTLTTERDEARTLAEGLTLKDNARQREDLLRPLLIESKVLPEHHEDVFMYASAHLTRSDDGQWLTKEGVGVTPGAGLKDWFGEMLERKPGWLPGSKGGGAKGSGGGGVGNNPWAKDNWNITEQGRYIDQHGLEKAKAAAAAVGSKIGATSPAAG